MASHGDAAYVGSDCHASVGVESTSLGVALTAVLVSALLIAPSPVASHDIYSGVYNKEGVLCCDERDCMPAPFRVTPDGVQMLVRGYWIDVPRWYIQYRALPGDTTPHRSHWCGVLGTLTRCAILPPQASEKPSEEVPVIARGSW